MHDGSLANARNLQSDCNDIGVGIRRAQAADKVEIVATFAEPLDCRCSKTAVFVRHHITTPELAAVYFFSDRAAVSLIRSSAIIGLSVLFAIDAPSTSWMKTSR